MYKKIQELLAGLLWIGCIIFIMGQYGSYELDKLTTFQFCCRAGAGIIILALDTWHISNHFDGAEWT